jgi:uncharacterized protein
MKTVFADTGYWIALVNPQDDLHQVSRVITHQLMPFKIITSELVFNELLNTFSKQGSSLKQVAINLIKKSYNNPDIEIVPQTTELFMTALELYEQRPDQAWSHTDCSSFQIMRQNNILEALAYDKHFEQAGFIPLLRLK